MKTAAAIPSVATLLRMAIQKTGSTAISSIGAQRNRAHPTMGISHDMCKAVSGLTEKLRGVRLRCNRIHAQMPGPHVPCSVELGLEAQLVAL